MAHRLEYHSTLGWRVITKKKKDGRCSRPARQRLVHPLPSGVRAPLQVCPPPPYTLNPKSYTLIRLRTWMILVESDSSTIDGSHPWLFAYLVEGFRV